ncbi:chemotaxis protein CheB [Pseudomonas koreensis]|jgi:two-component system chemotaxis response regulator CheB|uniref:protein-glutamate methylesterase n=3 Tax=Pseudomonas TaxID=286 RepID=A0A5C4L2S5_PSEJE|nr:MULTISPECIES: chemotaxis protein CheB [Pseudomonas]KAA8741958.1 chemotaxis protein CheB [Pseudomonas koreensis]MBY8957609.1 chemotaxis protein CheB [Pseudomonas sp. MIS38]PHH39069.1 chemotaxis protein CheB [Pseudomonas putida]POA27597.1 chemotaxis protein CheB [Pseudomonas sp. FW305-3-2-15-E-TSA4]POA45398.1 chemotaxis protein CheB [Pseudomonas sp. FW305-3-2-15-E-TSA2]
MNDAVDLPRVEAIVVGASAGGVEALLTLLAPLRQGYVLPIIVVLHLPEERRSQLAEVFSRRLMLPVAEATDKQDIMPGTVYFATPGYHLSVEQDRSLSLSLEDRVHHSRPAIDYLFESAADVYGETLAAVLLTGANHDGARGLAQVKQRGGLTIVQDPQDAQVATMPLAALKIQQPDHVLPIHGIGRLLVELERIAC